MQRDVTIWILALSASFGSIGCDGGSGSSSDGGGAGTADAVTDVEDSIDVRSDDAETSDAVDADVRDVRASDGASKVHEDTRHRDADVLRSDVDEPVDARPDREPVPPDGEDRPRDGEDDPPRGDGEDDPPGRDGEDDPPRGDTNVPPPDDAGGETGTSDATNDTNAQPKEICDNLHTVDGSLQPRDDNNNGLANCQDPQCLNLMGARPICFDPPHSPPVLKDGSRYRGVIAASDQVDEDGDGSKTDDIEEDAYPVAAQQGQTLEFRVDPYATSPLQPEALLVAEDSQGRDTVLKRTSSTGGTISLTHTFKNRRQVFTSRLIVRDRRNERNSPNHTARDAPHGGPKFTYQVRVRAKTSP
jgi:hypothetical protein